jgi:hypothetical protein
MVAENIYNTLTVGNRDDPFRESIVSILGLIESRDLNSQDGEDSLGEIARLKAGKKRVGS